MFRTTFVVSSITFVKAVDDCLIKLCNCHVCHLPYRTACGTTKTIRPKNRSTNSHRVSSHRCCYRRKLVAMGKGAFIVVFYRVVHSAASFVDVISGMCVFSQQRILRKDIISQVMQLPASLTNGMKCTLSPISSQQKYSRVLQHNLT
eukprot:TRINITY_DN9800_c0_g1_i3.p1 TRINITY_DN9800_c0_g1~~TRINITY_DN9800_c0_g1_i3.p1  ORF type:complete len:147 (-),score=12.94 TRINITY_DN9800_c0_g1_i3:234-674(-)